MSGIGPAVSSAGGNVLAGKRPHLTLYLDVISPFAYIAFWVTRNSTVFKQCDVTYVPILLGGVMKACGNTPPLNIKNKDKWIEKERIRWAKYFRLPIADSAPKPFPQPTVNTGRALCAIQKHCPEKLPSAFEALYNAFWVERKEVNKLDVISAALSGNSAFSESDVKAVVNKIGDADVKQMLTANTEQSLSDGAFGLPWFVAENAQGERESFWGVDHLAQVAEHLGLDRGQESGFRAMV